jgi:DNA polymerase-4
MDGRVILHCDCNSFFASVEAALNPEYRGVPMAVCGSEEDRHGIVLAKNELAKKYGIQTAETVYSARRKCPGLVIAKPHHEEYVKFSRRVNEIYARYTDMIEPFGIDESWLDVTASKKLFGGGVEIAERIRQEVKREIGITVSIGVSFNKVFAKLGSDYKKPDAITVISEDNFREIVFPLPASDLLFVGKKTAEQLKLIGVRTIGELAGLSESFLTKKFGKMGEQLYKYSNGLDDSPVSSGRDEAKSVGSGFTFRHDLISREECRVGIEYLADDIGRRLRKMGMKCETVQLSIKDEYLRVVQRQRPQLPPTDISRLIANTAYEILLDEWSESKPIRMLTVTATNLVHSDSFAEQIDLFGEEDYKEREKSKKKEETVDKIRQKHGSASILQGSVMSSDIGIFKVGYDGTAEKDN